MASSSYSRRKSSSCSPTSPEKCGALLSRTYGIAEGPVAGFAAMMTGGIGGSAGRRAGGMSGRGCAGGISGAAVVGATIGVVGRLGCRDARG